MKAVILYDDSALASRAAAILRRATHNAGVGRLWMIRPWRVDLLIVPPSADRALRDATGAHVLLVAMRGPVDLTPWLFEWLETWAERRKIQDAVLGVLNDRKDDDRAANAALNLRELVERHSLTLISDDTNPSEQASGAFVHSLAEREQTQTSTLRRIMDEQLCDFKWG